MSSPSPIRIFILASLAIVAFAGNSLLTRAALMEQLISPAGFTAVRLLSGAGALAVLVAARQSIPMPRVRDLPGIAALAVYAVAFTFAYVALGAATGALILFATVQFTMAGYATVQGQPPRGYALMGLVLALIGLAWLLAPGLVIFGLAPALLMTAAGVAWGFYTLLGRGSTDATAHTARNFIGTVPLALLLLVLLPTTEATAVGLGLAIASGALTSGLGYAIWYAVLPSLSVETAGVAQLSVPAVAAIAGAIWLDEPLTLSLVGSTALILLGIWLTIRARARRPAA